MTQVSPREVIRVRDLRHNDLDEVVRIDALHTGEPNPGYWGDVFGNFLGARKGPLRIGLAAENRNTLIGYLLGEVRAFEFGSEACGWIFSVGVDPGELHGGVASALLGQTCTRFREAGVSKVRTMVRRDRVDVLSFFRANGFVGGSFVQLELDLEEQA
jgi:ribosomal protein S18 acetylase RimI-like enzyme